MGKKKNVGLQWVFKTLEKNRFLSITPLQKLLQRKWPWRTSYLRWPASAPSFFSLEAMLSNPLPFSGATFAIFVIGSKKNLPPLPSNSSFCFFFSPPTEYSLIVALFCSKSSVSFFFSLLQLPCFGLMIDYKCYGDVESIDDYFEMGMFCCSGTELKFYGLFGFF